MLKSKKSVMGLSVVLAMVMVLSATYAWFTASDSKTNRLETAQITDGSASIFEVFTPPTEWKPGQTVTKQAGVANNGSGSILARVSFEEVMDRLNVPAQDFTAPASGVQVPQIFNKAAYLAAPWTDAAGAGLTVVGLPADVTLRVQKVVTGAGTPAEKTSYSFITYHEITSGDYAGQSQRVTADFLVEGTQLTVSNVKYWAYTGRTVTEAAWAVFQNPQTTATPSIRPVADIDYPATDAGKKIAIQYSDRTALTDTAPTAGKWWYNPADGFIYYIGKIEPGTISPNFMESLTLDPSAGETYAGMRFDLIINMEAIQNTVDAIESPTGWNLAGNTDLINALTPFCE